MTTKTAQFTPGPWTIQLHNDLDTGDIRGANNEEIAMCYMPDATLIAAAPAMYEALLQVRTALFTLADNAGDVPEWNEGGELYELSHTVKAALAQAEGR